jgi:AraC-like DNA-binding protein
MNVALKPVEESVFTSRLVFLAEYHCLPDDPLFANSGPSNAHAIVFPLTSTRIIREGTAILELPTFVTLYNAGVEYSSEIVSPEGSHCAWMTIDPGVLFEVLGNVAVASRPFPVDQVAVDASLALRQRSLFQFARRFGDADPLTVEDESIALVEQIAARIRSTVDSPSRPPAGVIERARALLAAQFAAPLSLADVARQVGVSPAYLSRAFRAVTGQTMHAFREELRLRRSLDLLPASRGDFTRVALDLGYSSHSHFSSRFRRYFGITPLEFVARYRDIARLKPTPRTAADGGRYVCT